MVDLKERYTETIRQLVPIFSLSPQYQNEVIKRSVIIELQHGQYLFKQGDLDDYSYYLLAGDLELQDDDQIHSTITANSDSALYPLAQLQPRQLAACGRGSVKVLQVDRHALDKLLVVEQQTMEKGAAGQLEVSELDDDGEAVDWMTRILQSKLFSRLPTANIHQLFTVLKPINYFIGDRVFEQGSPGDYYYIIQEGRCEVLRRSSSNDSEVRLGELVAGDGFGEEALLTDARRNVSTRMLADGVLMRMTKAQFLELIKKPALSWLDYTGACRQVAAGARWLDVRLAEEYKQSHLERSINLPLAELRADNNRLRQGTHYIAYCDSGSRSSVAAFVLTQKGYHISYLDGGLMSCPSDDLTYTVADPAAGDTTTLVDADVRVTAYETEVAVSNYEMEQAALQDAESKDESRRAEYEAIAQKLRAEHARLKAARKRAAEEARQYREAEEARIQKLRADTERQLLQQKEKLEAVYTRNTREMERLQKLRQEAETRVQEAQQKAVAESAQAQQRIQEADKIKQQLAAAQAAIEREADQQRKKQVAMEKKIQEEAFAELEAERKNLAEQYQRSSEALEEAKQQRMAAEAARQAANEEAQRIIAEFKQAHAKAQAEAEARLKAERGRLEQQSRELRESMVVAKKAGQEAEAARQTSEAQVAELKIRLAQAQEQDRQNSELRQRVDAAEAEAEKARIRALEVEKAQQQLQAAQASNVQGLAKQSADEQKLREQIELEVSEWLVENELEAPSSQELEKQAEHIRRIKARAEAAKRQSQNAAHNLLNEIAGQIGGKKPNKP